MERVEIVVVGAGVMGAATAWALGARGVPTVLLEQFGADHTRGSSHGATRIFRLAYPEPDYVRMAVAARQEWTRLAAESGEPLLVPTGGLDAGPGAAECARAMAACGVDCGWLDAAEVASRFPGVAARPGERMVFQADAGVLLAGRAVAAMRRLASRAGVSVRDRTPVLGLDPQPGGVLVHTAAGDIMAGAAVVTAGGWAGTLLAGAVTRVPGLAVTLQRIRYFAARPDAGEWPTLIEWNDDSTQWYTVPAAGGAPGVKVASHRPGAVVDPAAGPFGGTDPAQEEEAARYVRERLPGLVPTGLAAETCLYTSTADEDFVIDREGPVVVGAGGCGHAFKFGPLLGELLADLALGGTPRFPLGRFALTRPALASAPAAG